MGQPTRGADPRFKEGHRHDRVRQGGQGGRTADAVTATAPAAFAGFSAARTIRPTGRWFSSTRRTGPAASVARQAGADAGGLPVRDGRVEPAVGDVEDEVPGPPSGALAGEGDPPPRALLDEAAHVTPHGTAEPRRRCGGAAGFEEAGRVENQDLVLRAPDDRQPGAAHGTRPPAGWGRCRSRDRPSTRGPSRGRPRRGRSDLEPKHARALRKSGVTTARRSSGLPGRRRGCLGAGERGQGRVARQVSGPGQAQSAGRGRRRRAPVGAPDPQPGLARRPIDVPREEFTPVTPVAQQEVRAAEPVGDRNRVAGAVPEQRSVLLSRQGRADPDVVGGEGPGREVRSEKHRGDGPRVGGSDVRPGGDVPEPEHEPGGGLLRAGGKEPRGLARRRFDERQFVNGAAVADQPVGRRGRRAEVEEVNHPPFERVNPRSGDTISPGCRKPAISLTTAFPPTASQAPSAETAKGVQHAEIPHGPIGGAGSRQGRAANRPLRASTPSRGGRPCPDRPCTGSLRPARTPGRGPGRAGRRPPGGGPEPRRPAGPAPVRRQSTTAPPGRRPSPVAIDVAW